MFSSTDYTATNPLPQIPVTSATFHGGSHHILLPQLHQDHFLFPNTHTLVSPNNNNNVNNSKPRRVTKKDRHTKILTAQGPRDRRVRLSICIARKFFDLQDTLGFDKPSKTLNWLFAKSKLAIEDLIQTTTTIHAKMGPIKEEEDVVKLSRAKARARARARTIKKMCIKELNEAKMLLAAPTPEPGPLAKNELTPSRVCSVWDIPQHLMMPKNSGLGGCGGGGNNGGYSHNASTTIMSSQGLEICTKSWGFSDHNYQY